MHDIGDATRLSAYRQQSKLCQRKYCDVMGGMVGEGKAKRWSNNGRFSERTWKNGVASHRVPLYQSQYSKQIRSDDAQKVARFMFRYVK